MRAPLSGAGWPTGLHMIWFNVCEVNALSGRGNRLELIHQLGPNHDHLEKSFALCNTQALFRTYCSRLLYFHWLRTPVPMVTRMQHTVHAPVPAQGNLHAPIMCEFAWQKLYHAAMMVYVSWEKTVFIGR